MPLEIFVLPLPMFEISRYSSEQLLAWLERCEACRIQAVLAYEAQVWPEGDCISCYIDAKKAATLGTEIFNCLLDRDFDLVYLTKKLEMIDEDIRACQ